MRAMFCSMVVSLSACGVSEAWIYAPTASETVVVEQGTTVVFGEAILRYDSAALAIAEEVGNALRLDTQASTDEFLRLDFPDAATVDLVHFEDPGSLNVLGVFTHCGEPQCTTVVPFEISRAFQKSMTLEVSGDAILTRASLVHSMGSVLDSASLELVLE